MLYLYIVIIMVYLDISTSYLCITNIALLYLLLLSLWYILIFLLVIFILLISFCCIFILLSLWYILICLLVCYIFILLISLCYIFIWIGSVIFINNFLGVFPDATVDVVFLVERTTYTNSNWQTVLNFLASLTSYLTVGNSGADFGLIVFGNGPTTIFILGSTSNRAAAVNQILSIPSSGDTSVDLTNALILMRTSLFSTSQGDDPTVPNVGVVLMASPPSDNNYIQAANDAKSAGIRLLTIGIGSSANQLALQSVSSFPQQLGITVFQAATYNDLSGLLPTVAYRIAWVSEGIHVTVVIIV